MDKDDQKVGSEIAGRSVGMLSIAELIEDDDLYPRHKVDAMHVGQLVQAIVAGVVLPRPVVCSRTRKIVDGWHRVRAYTRVFGSDHQIEVELRDYESDGDRLFDAVQLNSGHGRKFDSCDQTRSVLLLERLGVDVHRIAMALHVTHERVVKLRVKTAEVNHANSAAVPGTLKIALKNSVSHFAGRVMTEQQALAHRTMPGTSLKLIAQQLLLALRSDLADLSDPKFVELIELLKMEIERVLFEIVDSSET